MHTVQNYKALIFLSTFLSISAAPPSTTLENTTCLPSFACNNLKARKIIGDTITANEQLTVQGTLDLRNVHTVTQPQSCTDECHIPQQPIIHKSAQRAGCPNLVCADIIKANTITANTIIARDRLIVQNTLDLSGVTNIIAPETCFTCNSIPCIDSNACYVFQQLCQPIDSITGCAASSQAVIDLRNQYSNAILAISPQQSALQFFTTGSGQFIVPPSGDMTEIAQWQQWTPDAVAQQVALSEATRQALINVNIPNMFEQERQELISLGFNYIWWLADPRRMQHSAATVVSSSFDSMGGAFGIFFNLTGVNQFSPVFGLDLTILSWNNYAESLRQFTEYLELGLANNIVYSTVDLENVRSLYAQSTEEPTPIVDTIAFEPFLMGTPEQQAAGIAAFQNVRDATAPILDLLAVGGAYDTAVQTIRNPLIAPGLSAPLMPDEVKLVQYPFALNVIANTTQTPAQIQQTGFEQVALIEAQIVEVVQNFIDPTVTDWDNFINRYRFDPAFRAQFVIDVTVQEYLDELEKNVYDAWSTAIKAFDHFPSAPVEVQLFPGFGAAFYTPPTIQQDGTASVVLTNGIYNSPSLSDTNPIDYNEIITVDRSFDSSTVFHETIPGHHLQIAMLVELACQLATPFNNGAFEGWAVYAEQVAANDMMLALPDQEPFKRLDFLSARLFRAARLVVDTGLHEFEMSRPEAIDYFFFNSLEVVPFIESEVDRYITWPGQAVGYLIGALDLENERMRAQTELGPLFNLREWHDVLIRYLAPVELLITQLTDFYISRKEAGTFALVWPPIIPQPRRSPLLNITTLPALNIKGVNIDKLLSQHPLRLFTYPA
ncbi:MAG: DUF885 family protein [Candidatus Babeliales bacterium]